MGVPLRELPTKRLLSRLGMRLFIFIMLLLTVTVFIWPIFHYFSPFIFAYIVTGILLMPLVKRLTGRLRKVSAIVLVVLLLGLISLAITVLVYTLISEGIEVAKNWDEYKAQFERFIDVVSDFVGKNTSMESSDVHDTLYTVGDKVVDWFRANAPGMIPGLVKRLGGVVPAVGSFLLAFFFFIMATYFVCVDFDDINKFIKKIIPKSMMPQLRQIRHSSISTTLNYIKAEAVISSMVAAIAFVVLLIVGQKHAFFWAIGIGIVDFIPMLGSGLVLAPWVVILIVTGDFKKAIIYAILTFCLFMFRRIVEPKAVGDKTGLHPLLTLISLYIGIKVGGIFGLIVAPIICMIFVDLIKAGFFAPTVYDFKELYYRIAKYSDMNTGEDEGNVPELEEKDEEKNS